MASSSQSRRGSKQRTRKKSGGANRASPIRQPLLHRSTCHFRSANCPRPSLNSHAAPEQNARGPPCSRWSTSCPEAFVSHRSRRRTESFPRITAPATESRDASEEPVLLSNCISWSTSCACSSPRSSFSWDSLPILSLGTVRAVPCMLCLVPLAHSKLPEVGFVESPRRSSACRHSAESGRRHWMASIARARTGWLHSSRQRAEVAPTRATTTARRRVTHAAHTKPGEAASGTQRGSSGQERHAPEALCFSVTTPTSRNGVVAKARQRAGVSWEILGQPQPLTT